MNLEVVSRVSNARGAAKPIRDVLAPRTAVSDKAKVLYVDALAVTILMYVAASWPKLNGSLMKMVSMAHVGLYRSAFHMVVKNNVEEHVKDAAVWIRTQRLPTDVVFTPHP
eukprot:6338254-Pyramimonas_sp.AAC.1